MGEPRYSNYGREFNNNGRQLKQQDLCKTPRVVPSPAWYRTRAQFSAGCPPLAAPLPAQTLINLFCGLKQFVCGGRGRIASDRSSRRCEATGIARCFDSISAH